MFSKNKAKKALRVYMGSLLYHNPFTATSLSDDESAFINVERLEMVDDILEEYLPFNETDDIAVKFLYTKKDVRNKK
jgi:hypothetical protein